MFRNVCDIHRVHCSQAVQLCTYVFQLGCNGLGDGFQAVQRVLIGLQAGCKFHFTERRVPVCLCCRAALCALLCRGLPVLPGGLPCCVLLCAYACGGRPLLRALRRALRGRGRALRGAPAPLRFAPLRLPSRRAARPPPFSHRPAPCAAFAPFRAFPFRCTGAAKATAPPAAPFPRCRALSLLRSPLQKPLCRLSLSRSFLLAMLPFLSVFARKKRRA